MARAQQILWAGENTPNTNPPPQKKKKNNNNNELLSSYENHITLFKKYSVTFSPPFPDPFFLSNHTFNYFSFQPCKPAL